MSFYGVNVTENSFNISIMDKVGGKKRARSFFREINDELQRTPQLSPAEAQSILDSVGKVRNSAKSHSPRLYRLQARFNRFSQARKIENLYNKVLFNTDKKLERYKIRAKDNYTDPYKFFDACGLRSIAKFSYTEQQPNRLGYVYVSISAAKAAATDFNLKERDIFVVPIEIDEENNFIRVLTKEESDKEAEASRKFSKRFFVWNNVLDRDREIALTIIIDKFKLLPIKI